GKTQYKTCIAGMPEEVLKSILKLVKGTIWAGKSSQINMRQVLAPISEGGKQFLDVESRNEAIALMNLKPYLKLGPDRPKWGLLADKIIAKYCLKTQSRDISGLMNTFLQTWYTKVNDLPDLLMFMVKMTENHGFCFKDITPSIDVRREMPIWHHIGEDPQKKQYTSGKEARCLRAKHRI
ncbi:hypothetical protein C8J56DRAFT_720285, partial [Mycena floridula]